MKKTVLLSTFILALLLMNVNQVCGQEDVSVTSASNNPAPFFEMEPGEIGFVFSADQGVTLNPGEVLKITVCTQNLTITGTGPNANSDAIVDEFDWEQDAFAPNCWVGTLSTDLPLFSGGFIFFDVDVDDVPSSCEDPVDLAHGLNVNLAPHSLDPSNDTNDATDAYTCAIPSPALPIDLVKFDAVKKGSTSLLDWETRAEVNNDRFDIYRSTDATQYKKIGTVKGNGNTTEAKYYTFIDESPLDGINYYRLKQFDFNGNSWLSNVETVRFDIQSEPVRFSPNPVIDDILFDNLISNKVIKIAIVDDSNRLIRTIEVDSNLPKQEYNLNDLNSGVYYLRFISADRVSTEKLIKLSF